MTLIEYAMSLIPDCEGMTIKEAIEYIMSHQIKWTNPVNKKTEMASIRDINELSLLKKAADSDAFYLENIELIDRIIERRVNEAA